jgi:hypothetical protein
MTSGKAFSKIWPTHVHDAAVGVGTSRVSAVVLGPSCGRPFARICVVPARAPPDLRSLRDLTRDLLTKGDDAAEGSIPDE